MDHEHDESVCVGHEPCPECGSEDNLARYDDGHAWCFTPGCEYHEKATGVPSVPKSSDERRSKTVSFQGEAKAIVSRRLTEATTQKWQYRVGKDFDGRPAHFAFYLSENRQPIAAKIRYPDKSFRWIGDSKAVGLYGQWLWRDKGSKLVITEGELDALSVSQLQGNKWPVVSIPNGAKNAAKAIKNSLKWIEGFDQVIFMFDMDEHGRMAAEECARLITPGKAFIASLPLKDASEMLVAGRGAEVIDAIWGAKAFRPDGIVFGSDVSLDDLKAGASKGYSLPYPDLDAMLGGLRKAELTLLTAGSGIGKSTLAREVAYHLHQEHGLTIGNVYLEESLAKTAQGYVAIHNNVSLGSLRANPTQLSDEQWQKSFDEVIRNRMFFYDHFGSLESDNLISQLRFMAVALAVDFIILDHISIVVSGQESSKEGERKDIDKLMTRLRSLIEETGVGIIAIVHLRQPEGKPHEEGGRVTLSQLRGSGSLKQLSDNVIALERDQQSTKNSDLSIVRLLKNREFGDVGVADTLKYHRDTGRMLVASPFDLKGGDSDDEDGGDEFPY